MARWNDKLDKAIDAGLKAADLFEIAKDDIITRANLRTFLEAAIASYTKIKD